MYCEYYGFVRRPFEMTPDPSFLFMGEAHREGLATLIYGVQSGKGFVVLTGEVGTGKTTLIHALLSQLDPSTSTAFIFTMLAAIYIATKVSHDEEHGSHEKEGALDAHHG